MSHTNCAELLVRSDRPRSDGKGREYRESVPIFGLVKVTVLPRRFQRGSHVESGALAAPQTA